MSDSFFVDTNVLIYVRDPTHPVKQARCQDWLRRLWSEQSGRLSTQVLHEYYSVVTRKLKPGLPIDVARAEVRSLASWNPVVVTTGLAERAWLLEDRFSLSWWDALIVAAAQVSRADYLLSEDLQDGMDFGGLQVLNPFRAPP